MSRLWLNLSLLGVVLMSSSALALDVRLKDLGGSATIIVNGKPTSPLMFFGWAGASGSSAVRTIDTEWREYSYTFTCPEDNNGSAGVHFRFGGQGPGTVWVDNVRLYPGPKVAEPTTNLLKEADFEGTRDDVSRVWSNFQADYAHVKDTWSLDTTTKVAGNQSLRVDIESAGNDFMHLHFWQTGVTLKRGQTYTYSLWMKADRPRKVDFMALHIGDPWTIYGEQPPAYASQVKLARDAGVHIYSFGIDCPWPKPGESPDFSSADRAIQQTLDNDPQALCLPRFGAGPPEWWLEQHPEDRELFDDGKTEGWCMASEAWRAEMPVHLRALVRHCEEKYGDHVLGYHPCGQHTGEWFYHRSWEPRLSDFSPAMSQGFAKWAQARYKTLEALRVAWNDPAISFEVVKVPTAEEQLSTSLGFFRDPAKERKVSDYFAYKQLAMEEPLELMARVIKDETKRSKLTCFFYGYLMDMCGTPMGPQGTGHLAMSRMARCPDVDILCSPISYLDREQGGAGCFMSAVDTVRTHGKLWLNEDDTRTYLTPKDEGFGRVDTPKGTHWVHERNFGQLWPRRLATWYMDLGGIGWMDGKDLWDNIAPMQRFYQKHINEAPKWKPEVAVILDEDSPAYTKCTSALHSPLVYEMRSQYYRMGAPFAIYLLSDLVAGNVPNMKAYFIANSFHLDAAQRIAVKRATRGSTVVWFYGGGFLGDSASDANMAGAVGLTLARGKPQPGRVTVARESGGGTRRLERGLGDAFGNDTVLDPLWAVNDAGAEVIGHYADGSVAAAAKSTPDGLRVYIGALHCPATLLRNIIRSSGVHVYCDTDDVVLTDGAFLSITATGKGHKTVCFPARRDVFAAFDEKPVAHGVDQLALDLELGETRSYLLR